MVAHMLAFVNFKYYRKSPENQQKYAKAYWYLSRSPRVRDQVEQGGTLWLVTSHRVGGYRRYALAYKLVKCRAWEPYPQLRQEFGAYGVIGDLADSTHFPITTSNDISDVLLDLRFSPEKPIHAHSVIGVSLLTARCLSADDINKLEAYEDKFLHGKHIFISYSSKDRALTDALQNALEARGHQKVWRDIRSIVGGERWEPAILQAIQRADAFIVLVSDHAAGSEWVKREVELALSLYDQPGKLKTLLPIVLSQQAWDAFPVAEIHQFQKRDWQADQSPSFFDEIANTLYRSSEPR